MPSVQTLRILIIFHSVHHAIQEQFFCAACSNVFSHPGIGKKLIQLSLRFHRFQIFYSYIRKFLKNKTPVVALKNDVEELVQEPDRIADLLSLQYSSV